MIQGGPAMKTRQLFVMLGGLMLALGPLAAGAQVTRLPFTSNFETGDFSEWDGFRNTTGVTIVSSGCQSGRCARAPLVTGTTNDNYGDFHFGDFYTVRGPKIEEAWLRVYSKFDAGYSFPSSGQKIAIINLTDGQNSTKHYQVYLNIRQNGVYEVNHSYFSQWRFFGLPQVATPATVRFGQWDKIKLYVRLNTPGQSNGIVRMWVNDQLKVQSESVNLREGTAYGMNKLNLSSYATPGGAADGFQWWDSLLLSTTDPDGGSTPAPTPMPPSNVRVE